MPAPLNAKAIVAALKSGAFDLIDLDSIHSAAREAYTAAVNAKKKQDAGAGLSDWESHQQMLDELINDSWDDHVESALVDSLLTLAGGEVYGSRAKDDDITAAISKIIDAAGDASNLRSELEGMSDEEDEYAEYEREYDKKWREANDGLQRFWSKYVEKKSPKKPAKKGR